MEPRALRQRVGERLGHGGEGVHVQRAVKPIHPAGDPSGEAYLTLHAQFPRQRLQFLAFLAVSGDQQAQAAALGIRLGKAAHQRGDVLDRVEPRGDAHHHAALVRVQSQPAQIGQPVPLRRGGGEVDAVVNGEEPVGREVPPDEKVHHRVGHADAEVQLAQGQRVDVAEGEAAERAAHVVQLIVAVDRGADRQAGGPAQHRADHVGPGTVAVDDLKSAVENVAGELAADAEDVVPGHDLGGDAELAGLLGKGTVPEADELGGDRLVEVGQQAQYVGLGSAGVAAADKMDDFHSVPSFENALPREIILV